MASMKKNGSTDSSKKKKRRMEAPAPATNRDILSPRWFLLIISLSSFIIHTIF
jgi:hypothetical protein